MGLSRIASVCLLTLIGSIALPVLGQEIIECPEVDLPEVIGLSLPVLPKTSTTIVVDVLALATPAKLAFEPYDQFRARVIQEIAHANEALARSGAGTVQFRLVGVEAVTYEENGDDIHALNWLLQSDDALSLRARFGADLVSLDLALTNRALGSLGPEGPGISTIGAKAPNKPNIRTRGHELGHNLGLRHNIEQDPEGGKEHGHRWCTAYPNCYLDIMAYPYTHDPTLFQWQAPHYSNPSVLYEGNPTGVVGISEAAIFAIENAAITAAHMPTVIPDPCVPDIDTMCLGANDRFTVEVTWRDFVGATGSGKVASADTPDSGLFWFFDARNWEILFKVLDGCGINDQFWVFYAATTTVEFDITVTDTKTGAVKRYTNALGHPADAVTDTSAFPTCGH